MKKFIALFLTLCMVLCLAACGQDAPQQQETKSDLTLALVVAGAFGDRSFYDSSNEGVTRLEKEGVTVKRIECGNNGHTEQIYNAAEAADIVVLVGWEFFDVAAVAPEFPDTKFIWIDNATDEPVENVLNITYAQNEGSFLAGYVAAKLTESGIIGAMGGEDQATINDFIAGYKQGALYANPDVQVEVIYSNEYDDPAIGKECALVLHEKGADVVFQIASKCGDGVFEAAQEEGFYAIGVDSDQKHIAPETIICSMRKAVGDSIYDAVKQYMEKGDECGLFGTTWVADMATGYVGLAYGEEGSVQQVSDEIKAEVEELAKKIISGEIVVDTTR